MGDEYTYDDYESVIESYDLGEVVDDYWQDDEYTQQDQYEQLAVRYYAWLSVDNWQSLCYNEGSESVGSSYQCLASIMPPSLCRSCLRWGFYNLMGPPKL